MIIDFFGVLIVALVADWLMRKCRQPGLVGMLLVGMLLGPNLLEGVRKGWHDIALGSTF